jgi:hypothetical protein
LREREPTFGLCSVDLSSAFSLPSVDLLSAFGPSSWYSPVFTLPSGYLQ